MWLLQLLADEVAPACLGQKCIYQAVFAQSLLSDSTQHVQTRCMATAADRPEWCRQDTYAALLFGLLQHRSNVL